MQMQMQPQTPQTGRKSPAALFLLVGAAVPEADAAVTGNQDVSTMVVVLKAMPEGPRLMVCPFTMSVVGVAPGPMVKVVDPIFTSVEPMRENVMPPAVTTEVGGGAALKG